MAHPLNDKFGQIILLDEDDEFYRLRLVQTNDMGARSFRIIREDGERNAPQGFQAITWEGGWMGSGWKRLLVPATYTVAQADLAFGTRGTPGPALDTLTNYPTPKGKVIRTLVQSGFTYVIHEDGVVKLAEADIIANTFTAASENWTFGSAPLNGWAAGVKAAWAMIIDNRIVIGPEAGSTEGALVLVTVNTPTTDDVWTECTGSNAAGVCPIGKVGSQIWGRDARNGVRQYDVNDFSDILTAGWSSEFRVTDTTELVKHVADFGITPYFITTRAIYGRTEEDTFYEVYTFSQTDLNAPNWCLFDGLITFGHSQGVLRYAPGRADTKTFYNQLSEESPGQGRGGPVSAPPGEWLYASHLDANYFDPADGATKSVAWISRNRKASDRLGDRTARGIVPHVGIARVDGVSSELTSMDYDVRPQPLNTILSSGSGTGGTGNGTTADSSSFTVAGSNKVMYVRVAISFEGATRSVSSVAWDPAGVNESLTLVGSREFGTATNGVRVEVWRKIAPSNATSVARVTLSGAGAFRFHATCLTGVNQSDPDDDLVGADGVGETVSNVTASTTGDRVLDVVSAKGSVVKGITQDALTTGTLPASASNSGQQTHTIGAGENKALFVIFHLDVDTSVTGCTVGTASDGSNHSTATLVVRSPNSNDNMTEIWQIRNPTDGLNYINWTTITACRAVVSAISFHGVSQNAPTEDTSIASATSTTPSIVVDSEAGEGHLILDAITIHSNVDTGSGTITQGAGQTAKYNTYLGGAVVGNVGIGLSTEAAAASVTMSWTLTVSRRWSSAGCVIAPALETSDTELPPAGTVGPGQNTDYNFNNSGNTGDATAFISHELATGASTTMSWTLNNGNDDNPRWTSLVFAVNPIAGTTPVSRMWVGSSDGTVRHFSIPESDVHPLLDPSYRFAVATSVTPHDIYLSESDGGFPNTGKLAYWAALNPLDVDANRYIIGQYQMDSPLWREGTFLNIDERAAVAGKWTTEGINRKQFFLNSEGENKLTEFFKVGPRLRLVTNSYTSPVQFEFPFTIWYVPSPDRAVFYEVDVDLQPSKLREASGDMSKYNALVDLEHTRLRLTHRGYGLEEQPVMIERITPLEEIGQHQNQNPQKKVTIRFMVLETE